MSVDRTEIEVRTPPPWGRLRDPAEIVVYARDVCGWRSSLVVEYVSGSLMDAHRVELLSDGRGSLRERIAPYYWRAWRTAGLTTVGGAVRAIREGVLPVKSERELRRLLWDAWGIALRP